MAPTLSESNRQRISGHPSKVGGALHSVARLVCGVMQGDLAKRLQTNILFPPQFEAASNQTDPTPQNMRCAEPVWVRVATQCPRLPLIQQSINPILGPASKSPYGCEEERELGAAKVWWRQAAGGGR